MKDYFQDITKSFDELVMYMETSETIALRGGRLFTATYKSIGTVG